MNFDEIKKASEGYLPQMTKFLRDLIRIPSESCGEEGVIRRTIQEMEALGFDKAEIDPEGNALGWMGTGDKIIAFDGHIDTVGIGNRSNWEHDPYEGYETDEIIYGRGGSDQEGGVVSAVYGAKIMKELGLIPKGYKILVTATVQEEDCDGLCWQYIHNEDKITPEFVVSTEPTDGGIYRGHRGRMEIRVDVKGISCHGSAPERGDNAIYKMADILQEVRALNENGCGPETEIKGLVKMLEPEFNPEHYEDARFLGRGTITVSVKGQAMFLVEGKQAGIFEIRGIPQEGVHHILNVLCASTIYPYLRANLADLINRTGLPPVHLPEVNFEGLYQQRMAQQAQKQAEAAAAAPAAPEANA